MINEKYKTIPNTNERYGVDRHGNVRDLLKNKHINDYSNSGSVKIKYSDGWRSIAQSRLVTDIWGETLRYEGLNPKEAIEDEIRKLTENFNNSVQVLKSILEKLE